MNRETILQTAEQWVQMTHTALALKRIPASEIQILLRDTYEALYTYRKDALVPKELCELLLEMDGFLYFASLIGDKEFDDNPYLYQAIHSVAEALKEGFFGRSYPCEFPLLAVCDAENRPHMLDLENGYVEDLI